MKVKNIVKKLNPFYKVDLYCNNIDQWSNREELFLKDYSFKLLDRTDLDRLSILERHRGIRYFDEIKKRLNTLEQYLCLAFIHNKTEEIAYTRWLCKKSFYSGALKELIKLGDNELLTLDSYTIPSCRKQGLHKEMNIRMLNYCKEVLGTKRVYMVIYHGEEYNFLHKTVLELGYKRIRSKLIFEFKILKRFF